jgi:uncharacterized BrkB/YihY/UPF0761 family membrane protein
MRNVIIWRGPWLLRAIFLTAMFVCFVLGTSFVAAAFFNGHVLYGALGGAVLFLLWYLAL